MGNRNDRDRRPAEIGRRPSDHELMVLYLLQKKLFTPLTVAPQHQALLQRYWGAHFVNTTKAPGFALTSPFWSTEGGFSRDSPGSDLVPTGELGLQCLVFFVEQYPGEARMMTRAKGGYPFAKTAVLLTRLLSEMSHLVAPDGTSGDFPVASALHWQLFQSEEAFYTLFALCFLLFEELYCEKLAADRMLPVTQHIPMPVVLELVDETKQRLLSALRTAPLRMEDLKSLCANGEQIVCKPLSPRAADASLSRYSERRNRTRSDSAPASGAVSRWTQHQSTRRKMRDAVKINWSVLFPAYRGVTPPLVPRPPAISLPTKKHDIDQSGNTFNDDKSTPTNSVSSVGDVVIDGALFDGLVVSKTSHERPAMAAS